MPKMPNPFDRETKPRYGGRKTPQGLKPKPKPKSKSNLEKAVGVASFAAKNITGAAKTVGKAEIAGLKTVGGFLMPSRKPTKMAMIVRKGPAVRKGPKAGVDTRPNEREPKRVAPRQRMPKELESMPPKRGIRPMQPKQMPKDMPKRSPKYLLPKKPKRKA